MEFIAGNIELEENPIINQLWDEFAVKLGHLDGIIGYKTPSLGKSVDETPTFIIRTIAHGIIIIDFVRENITEFDEDNEYWKSASGDYFYSQDLTLQQFHQELENRLKDEKQLYNIRTSKWNIDLTINKYLIFSQNSFDEVNSINQSAPYPLINEYFGANNFGQIFEEIIKIKTTIEQKNLDIIDSVLDGSNVYSKVTRQKIEKTPENINEYIKKSLDNTFKLDNIQRQIALQIPNGPQRIRGLAGTGKTIILCMKAALAHKFSPDMKILFVFNTQSMYNQVEKLITQYYFNEVKQMPNWANLHVLHAWGGSNRAGVYYNTANNIGLKPLNYMNVRQSSNPLDVIYTDLLAKGKNKIVPEYDIVLIDEAQDFPSSFFESIFYLTKYSSNVSKLKRIIWAYDEFQSLTDFRIKEPEELFGIENGIPNIPNEQLSGAYKGGIKRDFVLPNSYRNPRITLMVAHGLALGLYSENNKMPMEFRKDWEARGYTLLEPDKAKFQEGDHVIVEREQKYSKNNLERLLQDQNAQNTLVKCENFDSGSRQLEAVVDTVYDLIIKQKVEPEEILLINLDTKETKREYELLRQSLDRVGVKCITPGFIESNDSFKEPGFVTLSTPFRAKGNETNIVIVINSQKVVNDSTFKMRNAIFVSITRSRGWCFIYSQGESSNSLKSEIENITKTYPRFDFIFPSEGDLQRRFIILSSTQDLDKADDQINNLFSNESSRALLIERLSQDPKLLEEIKKIHR